MRVRLEKKKVHNAQHYTGRKCNTEAELSFAPLAIQHKHNKYSKKEMLKTQKQKKTKRSYFQYKKTRGKVRLVGSCLIIVEFVLLVLDKMVNFKI